MSEFKGVFARLPGVSCDRFNGINLNSDQFFLSHCHADHMVGLDDRKFHHTLSRKNKFKVNHAIYCSAISKTFLVKKFGPGLDPRFIKVLPPNQPVMVEVYNTVKLAFFKIRVTAIPANHCPGSVMFLFETMREPEKDLDGEKDGEKVDDCVESRLLYTGDFRFEAPFDLGSLSALHDPLSGNPLPLDEVYLDTTFASPNWRTFPPRDDAIKKIWELVQLWIRKNGLFKRHKHKHVVLLHLPAQFGSEAILRHIFDQSGAKWKIHVGQKKFQEYFCTEDLQGCTSSDGNEAQWIHACSWENGNKKTILGGCGITQLPCQASTPFEVLQIRPSAMYFNKDRICEENLYKCIGGDSWRVCYSCHSSLAELREFVKHFQPKRIVPCVVPKGMSGGVRDVLDLLTPFLDNPPPPPAAAMEPDRQNIGQRPQVTVDNDNDNDTQMDFLDNFCSPPKRKLSHSSTTAEEGCSAAKKPTLVRKITFNQSPCTSIDEEDDDAMEGETGGGGGGTSGSSAKAKRKFFQKSRLAAYSMPVQPSDHHNLLGWSGSMADSFQQNRRASLPHNLKIPQITITPSSPSPDPNHPDYPEFFEDKLYLESLDKRSCSNSSGESSVMQKQEPNILPNLQRTEQNTSGGTSSSERAGDLVEKNKVIVGQNELRDSSRKRRTLSGNFASIEQSASDTFQPPPSVYHGVKKNENVGRQDVSTNLSKVGQGASVVLPPPPEPRALLVRQQSIRTGLHGAKGTDGASQPDPLNQVFVEQSDDEEQGSSQPMSDRSVVCIEETSEEDDQELSDAQSTPDLETVMATCKNPTERNNCLKFVKSLSRETASQ